MSIRAWLYLCALSFSLVLPACGDDDDDSGGEGEGEGEGEATLALCTDGVDNDGDSEVDCYDSDCLPFQEDCAPPAFIDDLDDEAPAQPANLECLHDNPPLDPTGETVSVRFYAEDFQYEDRMEGLTIEVYLGNRIEGDPDFVLGPTDADGLTEAVDVPAQSLVATHVLAVENEVRETVEFDVETPTTDGEIRALVVGDSTYRVVPASLGITPQAGKGIVAGQFGDCDDEPVAGLIAEIEDQPDAIIRYFVDEMPAREPDVTTEDGLYVAINVEPGDHQLVIRGRLEDGGDLVELGRREVQVIADSINVVDLAPLAE